MKKNARMTTVKFQVISALVLSLMILAAGCTPLQVLAAIRLAGQNAPGATTAITKIATETTGAGGTLSSTPCTGQSSQGGC